MNEEVGRTHRYTFMRTTGMSLWQRTKVAVSVLLTPLTIILIGRSITVELPLIMPGEED